MLWLIQVNGRKEDAATKYDDKTAYKAFDLLSLIQLANYDDNNWEAMKYLNLKAKRNGRLITQL